MALTANQTSVVNLIVGMFDAAPGKAYLDTFAAQIDAGKAIDTLAEELASTPFFKSIYPDSLSNEDFAKAWVAKLFDGAVTDASGITFAETYIAGLLNGGATRADAMQAGMQALVDTDNANPIFGKASAQLENKMKAAANYSETQSALDLATLQGAIANVTDDPSTVPPVQTGGTFNLTNGVDNATANLFTANRVFNPDGSDQMNSLNDDDTLIGTGANSTLNMTFVNDTETGDYNINPTMNGIENINVKFTADSDQTLDLQDTSGVKNLNALRIDNGTNITFDNIQSVLETATVSNSNDNTTSDATFDHSASALSGTADKVALNLNNVQMDDLRIDGVTEGYEEINLKSSDEDNTLNTLTIEDTQTLNISGDKDLRLGGSSTVAASATNGLVEATGLAAGLVNAAGSLTKVDASSFTGDLTYHIGSEINAADDATGNAIPLAVMGGTGDDKFVLTNGNSINATSSDTDTIDGGEGTNTLVITGGAAQAISAPTAGANLKNLQALEVRTGHDGGVATEAVTVDADAFDSLATMFVRNEGQNNSISAAEAATVTFNDLTAAQALGVTVAHGTSGNNNIANLTVNLNLKDASGSADSAAITLVDCINTDARSNLILGTDGKSSAGVVNGGGIESVTINDNDSEDNTVALANVAEQTSKLTITGGSAGKFLNLDTTTAGANGGLYGYDLTGAATTDEVSANGFISDESTTANQVKIVADEVDASAYKGGVTLRVSTSDATNGAQKITTGEGDDTVIFDNVNDLRAGLTISDTVAAGAGNDTLVIDGNVSSGVIALGASEWTNVSGFENIRLVDAGAGTYSLTLTDALINANHGSNGLLNIINDNNSNNDAADYTDTATKLSNTGAGEDAVVVDARSLSATTHFSYNGEENNGVTNDRFILSDANINGGNIIDGGAVNNVSTAGNNAANGDIIEIRNDAVVTVGDLDGIKNIGTIEFTNDKAVDQTLTLQLNDTVVDALVDSYHTSTTANAETLTVNARSIDGSTGATNLNIDASALTGRSVLNVNGTADGETIEVSGTATINAGAGDDVLVSGAGTQTMTGGTGNDIFAYNTVAGFSATESITDYGTVAQNTTALANAAITGLNGDVLRFDLSELTAAGLVNTGNAFVADTTGTNGSTLAGAGAFVAGAGAQVATAATAQFLYNSTTGLLSIDYDGTGAGAAADIALIGTGLTLTATDFLIVA